MPDNDSFDESLLKRIDEIADQFDTAWQAALQGSAPPSVDDHAGEIDQAHRCELVHELVRIDIDYRHGRGETPATQDYLNRFEFLDEDWLRRVLAGATDTEFEERSPAPGNSQVPRIGVGTPLMTKVTRIRCPHCQCPIQLVDDRPEEVLCPSCGSSFHLRDTRMTSTVGQMRQLGKFQLLERRGLGAFGAVWKARDTVLDKIVALKIPHAGSLEAEVDRQRFQREARAAAQLRHPGIVTVHEVAELESSDSQKLPAIVSDFVDGITLRELLQTRRLTFRESALLIAQLADALDYAHSMGVIHRDIKPANIMLEYPSGLGLSAPLDADSSTERGSGDSSHGSGISSSLTAEARSSNPDSRPPNSARPSRPRPMILDFGLALRDQVEATMTMDGQRLGTPAYMSPEQAAGQSHRVDARSDVYTLGVILYEILCGELPFRGSQHAIYRQILNDEPQAPRRVNERIPRDLETICLKCLEKERHKRFTSAAELNAELHRFLNGEPIHSRPVSSVERCWRWAKRNPRVAVLSASVLLLMVSIAIGSTIGMLVIAEQKRQADNARLAEKQQTAEVSRQKRLVEDQRDRALRAEKQSNAEEQKAKQSADEARLVLEFFQEKVLAAARPEQRYGGLGITTTIRAAIDAAEPEIGPTFQDKPLVEASIRSVVGETYAYLTELPLALRQFERVQQLREENLGPDHPDTLRAISSVVQIHWLSSHLDQALLLCEETLRKRTATLGSDHPDTLSSMHQLATILIALGKPQRAIDLLEKTVATLKAKYPDSPKLTLYKGALRRALTNVGRIQEAELLAQEILSHEEESLGPDHPDTHAAMLGLAGVQIAAGKHKQAKPALETILEMMRKRLGPDQQSTLTAMHSLADVYWVEGQRDQALALYEESLKGRSLRLGENHNETISVMFALANAYSDVSKFEQPIPLYETALERRMAKGKLDDIQTLNLMGKLGHAYRSIGQRDKIVPMFEAAYAERKDKLGPNDPATLQAMASLGVSYRYGGKLDLALPLFEETLAKRMAHPNLGPDDVQTIWSMYHLAGAYQAAGKLDEALPLFEQTLEKRKAKLGLNHADTLASVRELEACCVKMPPAKAEQGLRQLVQFWKEKEGADSSQYAAQLTKLGANLLQQGKFIDAETVLLNSLEIREKTQPDEWNSFNTKSLLGNSLFGQKKFADAEPLLLAGYSGMKEREAKIPQDAKFRLTEAIQRIVDLYDAWNKPDQADEWRKQLSKLQERTPPQN